MKIYAYRKIIDELTTRELALPEDPATHQRLGMQLCTIEGVTYVALPDTATLPVKQPAGIEATLVSMTAELRATIKAASPHARIINGRVQAAIAECYSTAEEIQLLRTAPSPEFTAYNAYVEDCLAWGRAERAKLGL